MSTIEEIAGRATVDVATAARLLGISRNTAYAALHSGELPSLKMAGRFVIPTRPLLAMLGVAADERTPADSAA